MPRIRSVLITLSSLAAVLASCATGPDSVGRGAAGVQLVRDADVFYGTPYDATRPAVFDYDMVKTDTPEWKDIVEQDLQPGTSAYEMKKKAMYIRLQDAAKSVAKKNNYDLVVKKGDIRDDHGLVVADVTGKVKADVYKK